MKIYETVYSFKVMDEIKAGNKVYHIDKGCHNSEFAIVETNTMYVEDLIMILDRNNSDNKYEFFKIVEREKAKNE